MKFYSDNENKIVAGVGKFENGELEVNDPEVIEYMRKNYDYEEAAGEKLEFDDVVEMKSGGHYYYDGDYLGHGEEAARKEFEKKVGG